jgi:hypothetical protein
MHHCAPQFGTTAYLMSTNLMYYHDGDGWRSKDFSYLWRRAQRKMGMLEPAKAPPAARAAGVTALLPAAAAAAVTE